MEASPEELAAVREALLGYAKDSEREIARVDRNLTSLSPDDLASLVIKPEEQVKRIRGAVEENQKFLNQLSEQATRLLRDEHPSDLEEVGKLSRFYRSKPGWILANFMREWSEEGAEERRGSNQWVLENLEKYVPPSGCSNGPRVIFPNMRLGRLPFEAMQKGYRCEGTESDLFCVMGLEFMQLNDHRAGEFKLKPHCLGTCNRTRPWDHVREVIVPDVDVKASDLPHFYHGEFPELFSQKCNSGSFDALVTVFAVDGTSNILQFVRAVANILRPGGLWVNFGPLEYKLDDTTNDGENAVIELSWEELRTAISMFFDVKDEGYEDAFMATNKLSLMQTEYTVVKFAAIRNTGKSDPTSCGRGSGGYA